MTLEKLPFVDNAPSSLGSGSRSDSPASLEVSISQMEDRTLVVLAGELDDATVPTLRNALLDPIEHLKDHLVLDIGMLTFLDSSGLGLFVSVHKKLESKGCSLTIFAPTPMARRVLEITGLTEILTIQPAKTSLANGRAHAGRSTKRVWTTKATPSGGLRLRPPCAWAASPLRASKRHALRTT